MAISIAINWPNLLVFAIVFIIILMAVVFYGRSKKIHSRTYWIFGTLAAFVVANLITYFALKLLQ